MPNSPHVLRAYEDEKFDWSYEVTEDHSPDDIVFYLEKTEPRGHDVSTTDETETQIEVHRESAPSPNTTITVTVDPIDLGLEEDTRYERAVKVDDGTNQHVLDDGEVFILKSSVTTN